MRIRSTASGVLSLIGVLLVSGCANSGTGGTAGPTPTSTSSSAGSSGDTTEHGAPRVKTPLKWQSFEAAPCSLITTEQLSALGIRGVTGKVNPSAPGPTCIWQGDALSDRIVPGAGFPQGGNGLDNIYQQKADFPLFEPQPDVQGYPALLASKADLRSQGNCSLAVGVTDTQVAAFTIQMGKSAPRYTDPCGLLVEFANQVIGNIKAGAK